MRILAPFGNCEWSFTVTGLMGAEFIEFLVPVPANAHDEVNILNLKERLQNPPDGSRNMLIDI